MKFMSTEELTVYNDLLDSINAMSGLTTGEKGTLLIDALAEHEQAHDQWAAMTMEKFATDAAARALTNRKKSLSRTSVAFNDGVALRSTSIGVRTPVGTYQQKLLIDVTWDELEDHMLMLMKQMQSLSFSVGLDRKVLRLHDQFPNSTGPADACKQLGVSVDEFIGAAA